MITTYTDYPIFKDEAGNWQRSTTPVVYTVERDSSGPEYLLFSVNGRTVSKRVERDPKYEYTYKNLKTKIKAIDGAEGLFNWFRGAFDDELSPFQHVAMRLIERVVEGGTR